MKSGTTLLRKLLAEHPNLFGGLETHWFCEEFATGFKDGSSLRQRWLLEFFDVSEPEVSAFRHYSRSSDEFFDRFMSYCTARIGKKRWVEKTPDNVFHADRIFQRWPEAVLICLQRDPKDTYASWYKNRKLDLDTFIDQQRRLADTIDRHRASNPGQFFTVAYESLVNEPERTLRQVCVQIGEPYEPGLHDFAGDNTDLKILREVTGKTSPTAESLAKPIFTSSIGQWRRVLPATNVARIEEVAQEVARRAA